MHQQNCFTCIFSKAPPKKENHKNSDAKVSEKGKAKREFFFKKNCHLIRGIGHIKTQFFSTVGSLNSSPTPFLSPHARPHHPHLAALIQNPIKNCFCFPFSFIFFLYYIPMPLLPLYPLTLPWPAQIKPFLTLSLISSIFQENSEKSNNPQISPSDFLSPPLSLSLYAMDQEALVSQFPAATADTPPPPAANASPATAVPPPSHPSYAEVFYISHFPSVFVSIINIIVIIYEIEIESARNFNFGFWICNCGV